MTPWRRLLRRTRGGVESLARQTAQAGRRAAAGAGRLQRRPPRRAVWAGLGLAALLAPGLVEMGRLALRERSMEREIERLRAREEALRAEQTRLESDPTYVEGLIRSTFKQALPGELVIPLDADDSR